MPNVVLITGANRGIGLGFARLFKEMGWTVLGTARNVGDAKEVGESLTAIADRVLPLDLLADDSTTSIHKLPTLIAGMPLDLLINNAGIYERQPLDTLDCASLTREFHVNAVGPLLVSRALLPNLRLAKSPRIVNITSRMGSIADNTSGGSYGYRASKAALNAFTKSWAIDVADVPAVLVHPGYIATDMCGGKGDMGAEECVQRIWTSVLEEFLKEGGGRVKAGAFMHRDGQELPW